MKLGIITGSGTYSLPGFEGTGPEPVSTMWGDGFVSRGTFAGADVLHVSRHEEGHLRLSNHVTHQANLAALKQLGADAVLGVTVCGAVDPGVELGTLICFDDLHFLSNRLPDGSLCTFHHQPGHHDRGHWIYEDPYSPELRRALLEGAREAGLPMRDGGCYGHVDGPRFNTKTEIAALAAAGVTAVSQTGGPETVLAGEARLPFALIGFVTDHANGVMEELTPAETLARLFGASAGVFQTALRAALPAIAADPGEPAGILFAL